MTRTYMGEMDMSAVDESNDVMTVATMTLGYLRGLVEHARTDEAREMLRDWIYLVEQVTQSNDGEG